jgi:hypothetical protein
MQLRQLQVSNDGIQDRLILRIGTQANEEFRVYFTRRFLREIWPHLTAMLAGHLAAAPNTSFPPSHTGEPANFDHPFKEDDVTYPLGATPLLASEAIIEPTSEGTARLILREGRERSFNINLNAEVLQALCAMFRAANEQAGWDLTLAYDSPPPISQVLPSGKTLLH